jgi:hypothetical protein
MPRLCSGCVTTFSGATGDLSDACKCLDLDVNRASDNVLNNLDVEHFIGCANGPAVGGRTDGNCLGFGW